LPCGVCDFAKEKPKAQNRRRGRMILFQFFPLHPRENLPAQTGLRTGRFIQTPKQPRRGGVVASGQFGSDQIWFGWL